MVAGKRIRTHARRRVRASADSSRIPPRPAQAKCDGPGPPLGKLEDFLSQAKQMDDLVKLPSVTID